MPGPKPNRQRARHEHRRRRGVPVRHVRSSLSPELLRPTPTVDRRRTCTGGAQGPSGSRGGRCPHAAAQRKGKEADCVHGPRHSRLASRFTRCRPGGTWRSQQRPTGGLPRRRDRARRGWSRRRSRFEDMLRRALNALNRPPERHQVAGLTIKNTS